MTAGRAARAALQPPMRDDHARWSLAAEIGFVMPASTYVREPQPRDTPHVLQAPPQIRPPPSRRVGAATAVPDERGFTDSRSRLMTHPPRSVGTSSRRGLATRSSFTAVTRRRRALRGTDPLAGLHRAQDCRAALAPTLLREATLAGHGGGTCSCRSSPCVCHLLNNGFPRLRAVVGQRAASPSGMAFLLFHPLYSFARVSCMSTGLERSKVPQSLDLSCLHDEGELATSIPPRDALPGVV